MFVFVKGCLRVRQIKRCPLCGRVIKDYLTDAGFCYDCQAIIMVVNEDEYGNRYYGDIGPDWMDELE